MIFKRSYFSFSFSLKVKMQIEENACEIRSGLTIEGWSRGGAETDIFKEEGLIGFPRALIKACIREIRKRLFPKRDDELDQITLIGYSRAMFRTCLWIPELRIMLDCGYSSGRIPGHIFITHGHSDHSGAINHATECYVLLPKEDAEKLVVFVPAEIESYLHDYMRASHSFNSCKPLPPDYKHRLMNVVATQPGEYYDIKTRNNWDMRVEIIRCDHGVPSVGYGFSRKTQRLKKEYMDMEDKKELGKLRKKGVEITEEILIPEFVFMGDTTIRGFSNNETILTKYPVIIIECTFIDEADFPHAAERKHIHWRELKPFVEKYSEIKFILIHFSLRYKATYIREFFENEGFGNVVPFCEK